MNILLVDDDKLLAESTAILIERLGGHKVYITDEPSEIFRQCRSQTIDLAIVDVNLPGAEWEGRSVSGADLSFLLKSQPETAHIPIILLTAYAMIDEQQELLKISNADGLFAKPIVDFEGFLESLAQFMPENSSGQL